jgi:hypothetical protein
MSDERDGEVPPSVMTLADKARATLTKPKVEEVVEEPEAEKREVSGRVEAKHENWVNKNKDRLEAAALEPQDVLDDFVESDEPMNPDQYVKFAEGELRRAEDEKRGVTPEDMQAAKTPRKKRARKPEAEKTQAEKLEDQADELIEGEKAKTKEEEFEEETAVLEEFDSKEDEAAVKAAEKEAEDRAKAAEKVEKPEDIPEKNADKDALRRRTQGGAVQLNEQPRQARNMMQRDRVKVGRWIKQNVLMSRGLAELERGRQLFLTIIQRKRIEQAGRYRARAARKEIDRLARAMVDDVARDTKTTKKVARERIEQAIAMVLDGRMPMSQFQQVFNLPSDNEYLQAVQALLSDKIKFQHDLANMPNIPQALRKLIRNNDFYQTRLYAIHVLGSGYSAPQSAYINAVEHMVDYINDHITEQVAKGNDLIGTKEPFDLKKFLYADTATQMQMLRGVSKTKARHLLQFQKSLTPWMKMIESITLRHGNLMATPQAEVVATVARDTIESYMENARDRTKFQMTGPLSGVPGANLVARQLDHIFRDLYGEITSPGERMARTIEIQHQIMGASMMFQKIFEDGKDTWWTDDGLGKFSERLADKQGASAPITPQDRKRYGNMAGKFVTKETYDLLHGEGTFDYSAWTKGPAGRTLQGYQAWVRGIQLLWSKTMIRNAVTSLTGFAFKCGDALRPGFWHHWREGWKLTGKVMAGNPNAQRELADLVSKDVFDVTHDSILDAIQSNLEGLDQTQELGETVRKKLRNLPIRKFKKAMEAYALIDLPAKYASYMTNKERFVKDGMSESKAEESAVDHVRKFYQYRDFVPEGVRKLNRLPLADYFGYTVDSTRIWVNATKHAAESAAKGDIVPLVGLTRWAHNGLNHPGVCHWQGRVGAHCVLKASCVCGGGIFRKRAAAPRPQGR